MGLEAFRGVQNGLEGVGEIKGVQMDPDRFERV